MSDLLETYLRELREIRSTGAQVPETSYYSALERLLSAIGKELKPRVRCVMGLRNQGAGMPDGGLFTADQFQRAGNAEPLPGQTPSRGVIEVKSTSDDAWVTAEGEQVTRYWNRYRLVLVTNYRDFVIVGQDAEGRAAKLETYRLAENEAGFWQAAATPRRTAEAHGERFVEFLKRVMLHTALLAEPRDVAWFLASYARDARARVEAAAELPALGAIRTALEEALGLTFSGEKGDHFFRSTLVQTLFYGIFSAWVLWSKQHPPPGRERFDWRLAGWMLHVPMIRSLFEQLVQPSKLGPLGLIEVLSWTGNVLNRVDRAAFFDRFEEGQAVQYFYEPFLEAFDPELRKELGVWYTPTEIVQYMVARVDTVLREELDIADGLADPRVYVLDPCTGTGSYLVEVVKRIESTLRAKGGDALLANDLKRAATERVFGFEILPAPFVVAHLQLGLLLQNLGAPLSERERAGVYLTNALTGWEPPAGPHQRLLFPEMEDEREAAEHVKRDRPILVILGNPPYNGFAGVAIAEERQLSNAYRVARATKQPQGQGLNDLYVRFFRVAERRIVEKTGKGVICFISNYSWLDGLSFTAMRERYLESFDHVYIDCLNGDKYKTGKLTPEGEPDPSVFSTVWNPEGIQVGTAIALLVRKEPHSAATAIRFRHCWGKNKRAELVATAKHDGGALYQQLAPGARLGFPFVPYLSEATYFQWPALPDLLPVSFPGVKTSRDDVVVDIDRERLIQRMQHYFDPGISHEEMRRIAPSALQSTARFDAEVARERLRQRGFLADHVVRYCYRPFDMRWIYWEPDTKLLDEKRTEYFPHVFDGNLWIEARQKQPMERFDRGYVVRVLADNFGNGLSSFFPLYLAPNEGPRSLFQHDEQEAPSLNLSSHANTYVEQFGIDGQDLFRHVIALLHSPEYRAENAGALRQDWPRIPLPNSAELLRTSASLGCEIAAMLDTENIISGVTSRQIRPELRTIGALSRAGGGVLNPDAGDLAVTVGWGHRGQGGITMPGKGRAVPREYTAEEAAAIEAGAGALGLKVSEAVKRLGEATFDVYLNDVAYWKNVPSRVWEYTIGGYQVIKKWLSYRERDLLGRSIMPDEVREVTNMARRIAAILLLEPALDANYQAVKADTYPWPGV